MNKQELIEKYKNKYPILAMDLRSYGIFQELWKDIKQLDEPQKPKEKRYLVKIKGLNPSYSVLKYQPYDKSWFFGREQEYDFFRLHHTRKELEEAGFGEVFNSPLFEVEEVE